VLEKLNYHKPDLVVVDAVGLGAGVYDFLRNHYPGELREAYRDVKREVVFEFMRRLIDEKRLVLPDDDYFIRQFASFKAVYDPRTGGYRIGKTEGMRDDLADALAMALSGLLTGARKAEVVGLPDFWNK
jgi:predicted RNA-binding Zn ribbon-like protein